MKIIFIIACMLFSFITKAQYENCPDTIPVRERTLRSVLSYKEGQEIKINFNQYLRFEGVVTLCAENPNGAKTIVVENKNLKLSIGYYRPTFEYSGSIELNNKIVFLLNSAPQVGYWFQRENKEESKE